MNYTMFKLTAKGRATRSQYLIGQAIMLVLTANFVTASVSGGTIITIASTLCLIAAAVPIIFLNIRRWHDIGVSGWCTLFNIIPYASIATFIIQACVGPRESANAYGEDPREEYKNEAA